MCVCVRLFLFHQRWAERAIKECRTLGRWWIKGSFLFEIKWQFLCFRFSSRAKYSLWYQQKFVIPNGKYETKRKKTLRLTMQCNVDKTNSNACSFSDNIINFLLCCSSKRPPKHICQRLLIFLLLHVLLCFFWWQRQQPTKKKRKKATTKDTLFLFYFVMAKILQLINKCTESTTTDENKASG